MNKIKKLNMLFAGLLMVLAIPGVAKTDINTEHQAIIDTAMTYFKGAANADQALLASAFDMEYGHIKIAGVDKETAKEVVKVIPLSDFAKVFKSATKDTWKAKVLSVDVVDDKMAMVKLDFDTPRTHYVDYLVMYKRNGSWKIINKTFVANQK